MQHLLQAVKKKRGKEGANEGGRKSKEDKVGKRGETEERRGTREERGGNKEGRKEREKEGEGAKEGEEGGEEGRKVWERRERDQGENLPNTHHAVLF